MVEVYAEILQISEATEGNPEVKVNGKNDLLLSGYIWLCWLWV